MKKWIIVMLPLLLLFSCVGIETETTFNRDGSGTMVFVYRLSNMLTQMGEESDVELPFNEESLRESLEDAENVEVQSVEIWEDETDTYVEATITFESVEDFYEQDEYDDMGATLTREGGDWVYRQLLSAGMGKMTEEERQETESAQAMMAPYFEGYDVAITVNAPRRIKEYNLGELSSNGKTLNYRIPMLDLQNFENETYLEIRW